MTHVVFDADGAVDLGVHEVERVPGLRIEVNDLGLLGGRGALVGIAQAEGDEARRRRDFRGADGHEAAGLRRRFDVHRLASGGREGRERDTDDLCKKSTHFSPQSRSGQPVCWEEIRQGRFEAGLETGIGFILHTAQIYLQFSAIAPMREKCRKIKKTFYCSTI